MCNDISIYQLSDFEIFCTYRIIILVVINQYSNHAVVVKKHYFNCMCVNISLLETCIQLYCTGVIMDCKLVSMIFSYENDLLLYHTLALAHSGLSM